LSAWQNATGTDSHSLSIDPQFKNAQSGDYHLSSDSPCRDVGDCLATSADSLDIDGQPRIVGAAVDMGADEFAAAAPEIEVEQPAGTGLVDGTSTIDFGNVAVGSNTSLVFTITNRGAIDLSGLDIMIDGADAAMFTVTANPVAPVSGAGGSTTFIVRFVPTSAGMKTAAIHIASNDPDENPFDIALTGNIGAALQAWRQTYFGSIDNIGDGADLNDFDKDGLANILEFAFGLNPKTNSAGMLPRSQRSGDNFVVSFTQPVGVSGITYGAEWSQMLLPGSWTAVADTGNTGASPPQHTFSVPIGTKTKLYMRLKVTNPNP
jgi:hypothetical protein